MSIRKKLYLNFGLVLSIVFVLCLLNLLAVQREHSARAATQKAFDSAQASENIRFQMMKNRQLLSDYLLSGSTGDLSGLNEGLVKLRESIRNAADKSVTEQQKTTLTK